ncbi:macrophage immunometabolism regulator [Grus japonensis]|uniref:ribonuclease H n=1 Tax=Grus japonensis TaxID=30415 RepID=A0ABC9WJV3_GRUJA
MSAAVPDMLELQYELESKAAKRYATIDIADVFFSIPLAAECRPQFAFTWRGVQYTWNQLPQGWKHSPTICHGLIHTALEKGEALEHPQYIDNTIIWGNAAQVFEKGKKIVQILLKAGFAIKQRNSSCPGILEVIVDWPEDKDFGMTPEEEATCTEEAPSYNELRENEKQYALFTDGSCRIVGKHQRWKAAVWTPTQQVTTAAEGEGESSQFAEVKAIQQVDQAAEIEVAQVDLDQQHKGELFIAHWAHDTSGHQGRNATYRWAHD